VIGTIWKKQKNEEINMSNNMEKEIFEKTKTGSVGLKQAVSRYCVKHKQLVITFGCILLGVIVTVVLVKLKRPVKNVKPETPAPLVKVQKLKVADIKMVISGYGTVSPKVEVSIVPQVSGKIVWVNPQFKPGGFIRSGENLFKIDPSDYELAVQQAQAVVAEAMVKLDMETAEAEVAVKEWQQLHPGSEPSSSLVLREPQIRQAQAKLESAKAQLSKAQLDLARTELSLPIDVRIVTESTDLGQYEMSGQLVGTAYGVDAMEIELPLEDRELAWFDIPDQMYESKSPVTKRTVALVTAEFAGSKHSWEGYVTRTTGQIDKKSRLVTVVVEVPEPFNDTEDRPALLPGTFVNIMIQGKVLENAVAVPRDAVRNGNEVWVVDGNNLYIRELDIARKDKDYVYSNSNFDDDTIIVISSLDTVTNEMQVRMQSEGEFAIGSANQTYNKDEGAEVE
jgi:RND family efflux transporter MFP subunit